MANGGSVLLNKFQGYTATNAIPPDPTMAVGPNHIVALVNGFPSFFRIFDKQGNILKTISVSSWFAPVSPDESGDYALVEDGTERICAHPASNGVSAGSWRAAFLASATLSRTPPWPGDC